MRYFALHRLGAVFPGQQDPAAGLLQEQDPAVHLIALQFRGGGHLPDTCPSTPLNNLNIQGLRILLKEFV